MEIFGKLGTGFDYAAVENISRVLRIKGCARFQIYLVTFQLFNSVTTNFVTCVCLPNETRYCKITN